MKLDNDILIELQTLSPLLAGLQKKNVFSVPDGYFETLQNTILICLNEQTETAPLIKTKDIPTGYFDNLSSSILEKINAHQQENITSEEALSPLIKNLQHSNIFEIPQGYFENVSSLILDRIKGLQNDSVTGQKEISPQLLSIQYKNVFEVPEGYFDNISSSVLDKIKELQNSATNDLKEISPLLLSVQHKNVFEVPEDYFSTVSGNVLNAVKPTPGKVVNMFRVRSLLKYAVAALITGAMALGVYKNVNQPAATHISPGIDVVTLNPSIEKGKNMNEQQFDDALNNLTKDDITSYLEKNGSEEDVSLLTSSADEIDLPNKDEYLLDEKTLENYLDKIKFQN